MTPILFKTYMIYVLSVGAFYVGQIIVLSAFTPSNIQVGIVDPQVSNVQLQSPVDLQEPNYQVQP